MRITIFYFLLFIISIKTLTSQNNGENEFGSWYEITSSNRISNKFSISGSFTSWNYQLPAKNSHLLLGIVGLNYQINPKLSVGVSYAYGEIESFNKINDIPATIDHRIIEQVVFNHKSNKVSFSHRFRLEQRFLTYPQENLLKHRIRYRFKIKTPLNRLFYLSTYDEIHFNLNSFDFQQNRAFAGLGITINKNMTTEIGYARHAFKTKSFNRLSLQLNLKCDFNKIKHQLE